jgi:hypothetical protein
MTDNNTSHMKVSYRVGDANSVEFTEVYAVDEKTLRELGSQKLAGEDSNAWLRAKGCQLDSSNGPSFVARGPNSIIESYYRNGKLHRDDGPAFVKRGEDGLLGTSSEEQYWRDGELHRTDGPAIIVRGVGSTNEEYWREGKRHREGGPASILRLSDDLTIESYYRNGIYLQKDEYYAGAKTAQRPDPKAPNASGAHPS